MPQMGHDTKTDRLTDCQSQCDFDFDFERTRKTLFQNGFANSSRVCDVLPGVPVTAVSTRVVSASPLIHVDLQSWVMG
jgi:hypothetical protein